MLKKDRGEVGDKVETGRPVRRSMQRPSQEVGSLEQLLPCEGWILNVMQQEIHIRCEIE